MIARVDTRDGGMEMLLTALEEHSFVIGGPARVSLADGALYLEISLNVSKGERLVYLSLAVTVPLGVPMPMTPPAVEEQP